MVSASLSPENNPGLYIRGSTEWSAGFKIVVVLAVVLGGISLNSSSHVVSEAFIARNGDYHAFVIETNLKLVNIITTWWHSIAGWLTRCNCFLWRYLKPQIFKHKLKIYSLVIASSGDTWRLKSSNVDLRSKPLWLFPMGISEGETWAVDLFPCYFFLWRYLKVQIFKCKL